MVGHALCERLLKDGVTVYAVCRPGTRRAAGLPEGVRRIDCDVSGLASLPALLCGAKADAFFHLAWTNTSGAGRNDLDAQVLNVRHTLDACRAAAALGCGVFIGSGSQAEYGRFDGPLTPDTPCFPENGYGMAKLCAGQMSRMECAKLGWPRILSVYGPCDGENTMITSVIRALLAGQRPALTEGTQIWDYLFADDAAEGLYLMALRGRDGAVYPLGSGHVRPLREYVMVIRDLINPALPLGFGEIPFSKNQVRRLEADISALHTDTGFLPVTDFETGIRKTIESLREDK